MGFNQFDDFIGLDPDPHSSNFLDPHHWRKLIFRCEPVKDRFDPPLTKQWTKARIRAINAYLFLS